MSSDPSSKPLQASAKTPETKSSAPPTQIIEATVNVFRDQMPTTLAKRDGKFGKAGKKALVDINSHPITSFPSKTVYQYDVSFPTSCTQTRLISPSGQHWIRLGEARSYQGSLGIKCCSDAAQEWLHF